MIKAIALDDEPLPLRLLKGFCSQVDFIEMTATFTSAAEAKTYIAAHEVDLIFLDIQMPEISGINFLKTLPEHITAIFTTAFSEYAVEGFNLKAIDYLLKPFEFDRFLQAATKAKDHINFLKNTTEKENDLYVKADHGIVKVPMNEIMYLEGLNNYIKIHIQDNKPLLVRMSMKEMADKVINEGFMRIHRSYIIPLAKVTAVRSRAINLGSQELPVGINYVKQVQRKFQIKI